MGQYLTFFEKDEFYRLSLVSQRHYHLVMEQNLADLAERKLLRELDGAIQVGDLDVVGKLLAGGVTSGEENLDKVRRWCEDMSQVT